MPKTASSNVVILAKFIRPSLISEAWLARHDVIKPNAFVGNQLKTDELALFATSFVEIQAQPERLQLTFTGHGVHTYDELIPVAKKLVLALPEPGITAVGMNHNLIIAESEFVGRNLGDFIRDVTIPQPKLVAALGGSNSDTLWSTGLVRPWKDGGFLRIKFDPRINEDKSMTKPTSVGLACNFHFRLPGETVSQQRAADIIEFFAIAQKEADQMAVNIREIT